MKNISHLTSYSLDNTNIPDKEEDATATSKTYWIIMDYIDGCTLEKFIEKQTDIDFLSAIRLTQKLLSTIKQVHARGVVHRDIKPKNLLVIHKENSPIETAEIYVIDFGLAYIENREDDVDWCSFEEKSDSERTAFGSTIGNAFFRAPQLNSVAWKDKTKKEQNVLLSIRRSPTIDASGVCAILFWLITGIEPGPRHRDKQNLAPHQQEHAKLAIVNKIKEAVTQTSMFNYSYEVF